MFGVWHYRICWYVKLMNNPNERSWREIPNECLSADCYCSVSSAMKVGRACYNRGIELDNQAIQSAQLSVKTLIESISFSLRRHHVKDRRIILSLLRYHRLYPMPLRSLSTSRAIKLLVVNAFGKHLWNIYVVARNMPHTIFRNAPELRVLGWNVGSVPIK